VPLLLFHRELGSANVDKYLIPEFLGQTLCTFGSRKIICADLFCSRKQARKIYKAFLLDTHDYQYCKSKINAFLIFRPVAVCQRCAAFAACQEKAAAVSSPAAC
jgi:hypothetical protein